jgi:signal transduction histidine kinase/CheY-like chemotaxis protein
VNHDLQVFVVAPTGRDAPLLCDMLAQRGFDCTSCNDVRELCRAVTGGVGAIILTEEALVPGALEDLDALSAAQPPWSDIALILLTSNGNRVQAAVRANLERRGVRSVILIERPVRLLTLASTVESVLQSQKLESVGLLAGGIAHDFNNILTGVLGNASLALDDVPPGSQVAVRLAEVVSAAERAAQLTRQLLAYAGKGRFLIELLDLSQQVREISSLVKTSIPRTVQLRLELAEDLPPIEADAAQIQQVVMNLVINSGEAIPEGQNGAVLITTGVQDVDDAYIRTAVPGFDVKQGRYVTLEVHDTGVGIAPDVISRIFDPFFTTKFAGRGLGLAAVRGIVQGHGGAMKVYSTPGQGATFKLLFPASRSKDRKRFEKAAKQSSLNGSGTVLVIDDEEIVRRTARATLERFGYKVVMAEDGRQGLDEFRRLAGRVDVVLLDMTMPVMSGEETFRELRLIRPDVQVILSSGYNEVEAIRHFAGKGLAGFIQKPYTAARLAQAIRSVLKR